MAVSIPADTATEVAVDCSLVLEHEVTVGTTLVTCSVFIIDDRVPEGIAAEVFARYDTLPVEFVHEG